jgi:aspartate kinase
MKVFKFGGASVNSIERIQNVASILRSFSGEKILIVISAMGKTTNALEKVAEAFFEGDKEKALELFAAIKNEHLETAKQLLQQNVQRANDRLLDIFTEVEWLLHDRPVREFDYYYDQIVCTGELLSTAIISLYLNDQQIANTWIDVRDIFRTDNNFRDANLDWAFTEQQVNEQVLPLFDETNFVITQGFIGATADNESTTLGREGSDYTAAIFANLLNAESQTIWKDVEGVMNADPKLFPAAQLISELNYKEVIEMAYYGAQVIHPKTIKPLQNKSIPLLVKCFLNKDLPGTIIHNSKVNHLPPIIVIKENQVLLQLNSKDYSFVGEHAVGKLYQLLEAQNMRPNLTQNAAISFVCCVDNKPEKIEKIAAAASEMFDVQLQKDLTLLTVRHYNNGILDELIADKKVLIKQQSVETVQALLAAI